MHNFDVVVPEGNEKEFIDVALRLNYKEICFLSTNPNYKKPTDDRIKIYFGLIVKDISDIGKAKNFDFTFANAERKFFESKVTFITGSELSERKDSVHYRSTMLNQVHAKFAKKNNTAIVFSFWNSNSTIYLGRMMQDAVLIKKYGLDYDVFTFAKKPAEMRSRVILNSLARVLGL